MKIRLLFTLTTLASLTIVTISSNLVTSRRCPWEYGLEEYKVFDELLVPRQEAIDKCKIHNGKLGIPVDQLSWSSLTNRLKKAVWVGVEFEKYDGTKIKATTSDGETMTSEQRALLTIDDDVILKKMKDSNKTCLIFSPSSTENTNWIFEPESCGDPGVTPRAGALCQCVSEKEDRLSPGPSTKDTEPEEGDGSNTDVGVFVEANSQARTAESENSTDIKLVPRKREGVVIKLGNDDEDDQSGSPFSTPLGIIVGTLIACCIVGTTYYISKRRGWNIRQMVSRRMPYNRPRVSQPESENQAQTEQEMVDMGFPNNRQIHVYEEIIPRNSASMTPRDVLLSRSSAITIPQDPPPEPPNVVASEITVMHTRNEKVPEDGYLRPSFRRGDTIPGDVRSPPPIVSTIFAFSAPSTHISRKKKPILPEKEIKYASVETIHTVVDEAHNHDEEYFTEEYDENENDKSSTENARPLIVELPESTSEDFDQLCNSYVPINGTLPSKTKEVFRQPSDVFSPVFPIAKNEYENGRFLSTVMKMPPGAKPKRRNIEKATTSHLGQHENESAVYSRIPSASNEPIYSKITKTNDKSRGPSTSSRESGGYTPMKRNADSIICPYFTTDTVGQDQGRCVVDATTVEYDLPPEDNVA